MHIGKGIMQVLGDAVNYLCTPAKLILCMPDCATDTPIEQRHLYICMESDGEMRLRNLALQAVTAYPTGMAVPVGGLQEMTEPETTVSK